jgi:hypothetical protein
MKRISLITLVGILIVIFFSSSIKTTFAENTYNPVVKITGTSTTITGYCVGTPEDCSKPIPVQAVCSNNTLNVCKTGTFEDVPDTDKEYLWKCNGLNGGKSDDCTQVKPIDAVCSQTIANTCDSGSFMDVSDSTSGRQWSCNSRNGGTNSLCVNNSTKAYFTYLYLKYFKLIGFIILIIGLVILSLYFLKKKNRKIFSLFVLLFISSAVFLAPSVVSAETTYWPYSWGCTFGGISCASVKDKTISNIEPGTNVCLTELPHQHFPSGDGLFGSAVINHRLPSQKILSEPGCIIAPESGTAEFKVWSAIFGSSFGSEGTITYTPRVAPRAGGCGSTPHTCSYGDYAGDADIDDTYIWGCTGTGGTTNCTAPRTPVATAVNGVCNNATKNCSAGTFSDVADTATAFLWNCVGTGGGATANCQKAKPVTGMCGTALNSCTSGRLEDIVDSGTDYLWNCSGTGSGGNAYCSKAKSVNGVCNNAAQNVCTAGDFADVTDTETAYLWNCNGRVSGTSASCSLPRIIRDPECSVTPHTCLGGTLVDLPDSLTTYMWTCKSTAPSGLPVFFCSQPIPNVVNGDCSSIIDECNTGTFSNVLDTPTQALWKCIGSNGGTTGNCSKEILVRIDGECDNSTRNSCSTGDPVPLQDDLVNNLWKWKCKGIDGGVTVNCSMDIPLVKVDGACGATQNQCLNGTKLNFPHESPTQYQWDCIGLNGGKVVNCFIDKPITKVNGQCNPSVKDKCLSGDFYDLDDLPTKYKWQCNSSTGGISPICLLDKPLECTVEMTNPPGSPVNINVNTTWKATPPITCLYCNPTSWTVVDDNGTTHPPVAGQILNQTFTTIGLKTVSTSFATSSTTYNCSASTTVVRSGGVNVER